MTFPRPQQLVTTTATANTAMVLAATPSYTDDFEQQRNEMKENGIDASMIQSTLPNLTVDRIQTKTKQKHQRKPSTLRAYGVCYYWALSVQMAGKLFCVKSPSSHVRPRPKDNQHGQANVAGPRRSSFRRSLHAMLCSMCNYACVSLCLYLSLRMCVFPSPFQFASKQAQRSTVHARMCLFVPSLGLNFFGRNCLNLFGGTVTDD